MATKQAGFARKPSSRPTIDCSNRPSRTKQEFKASADINFIVERHAKTGLLEHVNRGVPQFIDAAAFGSYQEMQDQLSSAATYFEGLPPQVREVFDNDLFTFIDDMSEGDAAEKLKAKGLAAIDEISAVPIEESGRPSEAPEEEPAAPAPEPEPTSP